MRYTLLANAAAFSLFTLIMACLGLCCGEVLLFQLVVQVLTNEFWVDVFMLPFKGQQLFGGESGKLADAARIRRVARWTSVFLLLFPALVFAALACIDYWGKGSLGRGLQLPLEGALFAASLAAQAVLAGATLLWGLVPLSYRTVIEALMARHERRLRAEGSYPQPAAPTPPSPTHAGVEGLPHGLPAGVELPPCLLRPQRCSPLHARHVELVRAHWQEGEQAILSTAPAGVVPLPTSSNERLLGGTGLVVAVGLLYAAMGLFEAESARMVTRWVVLSGGLGLLPVSLWVLRAAARRQSLLRRTDYIITAARLHVCCQGVWEAVELESMEVLPGGVYGEGRGDVVLCPESGSSTYTLVNVEHAEELCELLERLIYRANAR